jgi:hypothetical protein
MSHGRTEARQQQEASSHPGQAAPGTGRPGLGVRPPRPVSADLAQVTFAAQLAGLALAEQRGGRWAVLLAGRFGRGLR